MASSYPSGFDSLAKPTATTKEDDAGFEHDVVHTNEANAIEAVEATLGLNPQGASATVRARMDLVDTSLAGKVGTSDSRLTDARTPSDASVTDAKIATTLSPSKITGTAVVTADARLSDARTPSDASVTDAKIATTLSPNKITGTAVVTADSRLSDARTPTAHAASHASAGADAITLGQSQVTSLTTDLAGKAPTARTLSTTAPLAGGGDLSADRTLTIADATTTVKGAVQLTDSTSSTSTTTAATPSAVKSAYDIALGAGSTANAAQTTANAAVPKSTVTTTGDLIIADGASSVTRLAAGTSGQVLTANGAGVAPTYQAAAGDGKLFVQTGSATPSNANGNNNDFMALVYDASATTRARLIGPKTAGAWPTGGQIDSDGNQIMLPIRSKTMRSGDLISGWEVRYGDFTATGSAPSDFQKDGTFGGAWYSSTSGTSAAWCRNRTPSSAALAFLSVQFQITTLPESSRFLYVGNIAYSGGVYGYCAKISSTGAVLLQSEDAFSGSITLDSGMTVAANDFILFERFGHRLTIQKTSGTAREWLGQDNATVANRPLIGRAEATPTTYGAIFSVQSFGLSTDSASVRINNPVFQG